MSIIIENSIFSLTLNDCCEAESLIYKPDKTECLAGESMPFFSLTEDRPFNNELKLAYPNKKTVFSANKVRREGNQLIIGFELIGFEAVVEVTEAEDYITFTLKDFIIKPEDFAGLAMSPPPVSEFRLVQLPVMNREHFGQWLNVMWDDKLAVDVLSVSPHARIESEEREDFRILTADAIRDIKLRGCGAALIVSKTDDFLGVVEHIENDYGLPNGVESRRSESINKSSYFCDSLTPDNVDEHLEYMKKAGLGKLHVYHNSLFKTAGPGYGSCGNYDFNDEYPEKKESLRKMLDKVKAAGIIPGFHFLHTHIGLKSRYVTPVADYRLNLTRHFTLSEPLNENDTTIYVEENPEGSVTHEKCRILRFGGELIYYESYSTEIPYCFTGCRRGHADTNVTKHNIGEIGGILDVSEYQATSVYLNQYTSLQDEIAEKLADAYDAGFEYIYFDGSEGTNPPYDFHVSNAQYRVYKKLAKKPLHCEAAAKSHFGWHMISGGNAFDVFPTNVFKEKIAEFPLTEAANMANDFTRLNFGWWAFREDTQPDMYEYGTSRAAGWDCPATIVSNVDNFKANPRTDDIFEVLRRWEDVRNKKWLTDEQKKELRNPDKEHTLIINENGEYELHEYTEILKDNENVAAFVFERCGRTYAVCWHKTGSGKLCLPLTGTDIKYYDEIAGDEMKLEEAENGVVIPLDKKRYVVSSLSREQITEAFKNAKLC